MNQIGEKIDVDNFPKTHLPLYPEETRKQLFAFGNIKVLSWGANNWQALNYGNGDFYFLRFSVTGRKFRGHIYIVLNPSDTYDVYYCTSHGTIKMISNGLYFDQLTEVIDNKIERVPEYKH